MDPKEELVGILSLKDLRPHLSNFENLTEGMVPADLMTKGAITISAHDNLEKALNLFQKHRTGFLPVIDPLRPEKILGIFQKDDLL